MKQLPGPTPVELLKVEKNKCQRNGSSDSKTGRLKIYKTLKLTRIIFGGPFLK